MEGLGAIFRDFRTFFGMLPRRCTSNIPSRNPSSDLSHVGRADTLKKVRICRATNRLARIAALLHLKTQTPRTPRTLSAKNSTTTAENKRVGRRWSPPGGLQLFLVQEAADQIVTAGRPAPRAGLALLFLVQEAADQIATTGRPAPIAGLALLFLVQEAGLEQR